MSYCDKAKCKSSSQLPLSLSGISLAAIWDNKFVKKLSLGTAVSFSVSAWCTVWGTAQRADDGNSVKMNNKNCSTMEITLYVKR